MGPSTGRPYYRMWIEEQLSGLFAEPDCEAVVSWVSAHRGRPKVVLIGSGFSRNARLRSGQPGRITERVPLWTDVLRELRSALGYSTDGEGPTDPLLVAEQFQESQGGPKLAETLLSLLRDDEIEPGSAHNALKDYNIEAIVTTNQLDTLLDRMDGEWFSVIDNSHLPIARSRASRTLALAARQIVYLHGHRSAPETWVFSRSEYETVYEKKTALIRRVQQLLSEYPLLVLGYSLSDPDFHWLFSSVHRELEGFMPRALCVTVGAQPKDAERSHWLQMGMRLAHMSPRLTPVPDGLARFLNLESQRPPPDTIVSWLGKLEVAGLDGTTKRRLDELQLSLPDLAPEGAAAAARSEVLFRAWRACLPTYPVAREDPRAPEEARPEYKHLPARFADHALGEGRNLLEASEMFLDRGGSIQVLGDWLSVARRWGIRPRPGLTLGEAFELALGVLAEKFVQSGPGECHESADEASMKAGYDAVMIADWTAAVKYYGDAADAFVRSGNDLGAWRARTSRRCAMGCHLDSFHMLAETDQLRKEREEARKALDLEQARVANLRAIPAVIEYESRRSRIVEQGLKEVIARAEALEVPGRFSRSFNVCFDEVFELFEEQRRARVFPGLVQPIAELVAQLDRRASSRTRLQWGLEYQPKAVLGLLARQDGSTLQRQREDDEQLCAALCEFAERDRTPRLGSTAYFAQVLERVGVRLTPNAARLLANWLVEEAKAQGAHGYQGPHGTGSPILLMNAFGRIGWLGFGGDAEFACTRLEELLQVARTQWMCEDRYWTALANWSWETVLSPLQEDEATKLLNWCLNAEPPDRGSRVHAQWVVLLINMLFAAAALGWRSAQARNLDRFQAIRDALPSGSWFALDLQSALHPSEDPIPALQARVAELPPEELVSVAKLLLRKGVRLEAQSALRRRIELTVNDVMSKADSGAGRLHAIEVAGRFEFVAYCLALGVGDMYELQRWLLSVAERDTQAPLDALAWSFIARSWPQGTLEHLIAFPSSPARDHYLLMLLAELADAQKSAVPPGVWWAAAAIALRCVDSCSVETAKAAVWCLVGVVKRSDEPSALGGSVFRLLCEGLRRCAEHPSSDVRALLAYHLAALGEGAPSSDIRAAAGVPTLLASLATDHTALVLAHLRYGEAQVGKVSTKAGDDGVDGDA